jgi:hypothetical protein
MALAAVIFGAKVEMDIEANPGPWTEQGPPAIGPLRTARPFW